MSALGHLTPATDQLLAGSDLIVLYHLGPPNNLALDKLAKLFRRGQLILDPLIIQTPLDRWLTQSLGHGGIHPHDNVARSFRRRKQATKPPHRSRRCPARQSSEYPAVAHRVWPRSPRPDATRLLEYAVRGARPRRLPQARARRSRRW